MILGWFMENPLAFGRAGTGIRDCIWKDREWSSASDLELASSAVSAGAGGTGDTIGITTGSCSTTTPTFPTAESLSTVSTSMLPADFTAAIRVSVVHRSMDSRGRIPRAGHTLERLAALTTGGPPEASPHVGSRASVEDSMEVVSIGAAAFTAEAGTGDTVHFYKTNLR